MSKAKVFFFFLVCILAGCENRASQSANTNQIPSAKTEKLTLRMERTGCYGTCPVYILNIEPDGKVLFEGKIYTQVKGKAESTLSEQQMVALIKEINEAAFFSLKDDYTNASNNCPSAATDNSTVKIYIKLNEKEKNITHYLGCLEEYQPDRESKIFPEQLYNLENKIDEIIDTKRWIGGQK